MLNEILNGKSSEPPPPSAPAPTAQPSLEASFALAAASARAYERAEEESARRRRNRRWTAFALAVVSGLAVWFLRHQMRADEARMHEHDTYVPSFEGTHYDYALSSFASDICACTDLRCAREVEHRFALWSKSADGTPPEGGPSESADHLLDKYLDCARKLESP